MAALKKRVRIEIADGSSEKVTITLEGHITRERVLRLMDIMQLLGTGQNEEESSQEDVSKFDRVLILLQRKFPAGWFTSQDVMVAYEDLYDEPIGLSTVSTYLARLVERGMVSKSGGPTTRRYRLRNIEGTSRRGAIAPKGRDKEYFR